MAVRNHDWYNLNEQRPWPLDELALLKDKDGQVFPHDLIAGFYIRFPETVGDRAYFSSFTVSPDIVTATILSTNDNTPLAAVSVRRPINSGRHYELEALYPGVGGWIAFGDGVSAAEKISYRFDDPMQSIIQLQSARKYRPLPVSSMGKLFANPGLTGVVQLLGGNDIEIVKEDREIAGVVEEAIVIRLASDSPDDDRNLFDIYRGPCGRRPESRNCSGPEPIEYINNVEPDCCGRIALEFHGCSAISLVDNEGCSVIVDCGFGLGEACVTGDRLPDPDGTLPNEYNDLCTSVSISIVLDEDSPAAGYSAVAFTGSEVAGLPYTENFEDGFAHDMTVVSGSFDMELDTGGFTAYASEDTGRDNVAVLNTGPPLETGWSVLYKEITANLTLKTGAPGTRHNGGIAINYRPLLVDGETMSFLVAELDWDGVKSLNIRQFNGGTYNYLASIPVPELNLEDASYELKVTVFPQDDDDGDGVWLNATVTGNEDAVSATTGQVLATGFTPAEGNVGIYSHRAKTYFHNFTIEHADPVAPLPDGFDDGFDAGFE